MDPDHKLLPANIEIGVTKPVNLKRDRLIIGLVVALYGSAFMFFSIAENIGMGSAYNPLSPYPTLALIGYQAALAAIGLSLIAAQAIKHVFVPLTSWNRNKISLAVALLIVPPVFGYAIGLFLCGVPYTHMLPEFPELMRG